MKHVIEKENEYFTVYSIRDYNSNSVKVPLLRTKNESEAELMLKYLES